MQIMIVPGNGNADMSEIWFPSVTRELRAREFDVIAKNMPDPDVARKQFWLPFIHEQLHGDENAILIGHSSGAIAILRYLEEHRALGAVLIGTYHSDLNDEKEKMSGYFDEPWHWDTIMKNVKWIIQFASTDDPYIPIEEARYVRDHLHSEYYEYTDQGHFSSEVNKTEFPELVTAIQKKVQSL